MLRPLRRSRAGRRGNLHAWRRGPGRSSPFAAPVAAASVRLTWFALAIYTIIVTAVPRSSP